jgi:hypothetical protein
MSAPSGVAVDERAPQASEATMQAVGEVTVTLTAAQVGAVVRSAMAPAGLLDAFSAALGEPQALVPVLMGLLEDRAYSRSVLRAVIVLAAFPSDGSERELTAVAEDVGLSPSTTHRYLRTWTAAGLLERDPDSRSYRRARISAAFGTTG